MRIASLSLTNFKRFTQLTIKDLPQSAKLVLLIGSNGSGKSSVFDALNRFRVPTVRDRPDTGQYFSKKSGPAQISLQLHGRGPLTVDANSFLPAGNSAFYGRPSIRVVPAMQRVRNLGKIVHQDNDNPGYFTAFDTRFFADVAQFVKDIDHDLREPTFAGQAADTVAIYRRSIEPLNDALRRIFGENLSTTIQLRNYDNSDSEKPINLSFCKGESTISFDLLSHGEKQVVILLMNFLVRGKHYQDTVYFIDEMDLHLNTALQRTVLREIVENWIPGESQLWTSSHALGFIEYADESGDAAIIDFDDLDFDQPQELTPRPKQSISVFEIAVPRDSLARLFAGRKVIACEGKDDALYNAACDDASRIFIPAGNAAQVFAMMTSNPALIGLRDRDYLLTAEISALQRLYPNYRVLPFYSIESLLYHPDNIASLQPTGYDPAVWQKAIRAAKDARPLRDLKYARSRIAELRSVAEFQRQRPPAWEADAAEIYTAYESPDFETYYPVVAMKELPKSHLERFGLTPLMLARAPWFMAKLKELTA